MRRFFLILLAVLIPLKAVASAAVSFSGIGHGGAPIVHQRAALATPVHVAHALGDAAAAAASDCCDTEHAGSLSPECPHLAMPLLAAMASAPMVSADRVRPPVAPQSTVASVVHDVLNPPPLSG